MKVATTSLPGVLLLEPSIHEDERGMFAELWRAEREVLGVPAYFAQQNVSVSRKGVLRGLHMQVGATPQGKLITVLSGRIHDVAVDARRGSPSFGQYAAFELAGPARQQLYIPPGCLHGFLALTDATVMYQCTTPYRPQNELSVRFDDPELEIEWPTDSPTLSPKDAVARSFAELPNERLVPYRAPRPAALAESA